MPEGAQAARIAGERMIALLLGLTAVLATYLGGYFALRHQDKLHLILGFSAGAVIGVAFFDLMPEALNLAGKPYGIGTVTSITAVGFLVFMLLNRLVVIHYRDLEHPECLGHQGALEAGSLSIHSFLDGLAIGLSFHVSPAVGAIVAAAVILHDFSDGINTVSVILKNGGSTPRAFRWLLTDAVAPFVGVLVARWLILPQDYLGLLLGLFCGFFLYIGASDLLPESQHGHPTFLTSLMTTLGALLLYLAVRLARILG
ncbi:MAG TPA: ZIP family metal transporter [Chthonomonadaceae bacterium]|nr:ZIP family metal transporter [Chthonomonadaceae bacterium]